MMTERTVPIPVLKIRWMDDSRWNELASEQNERTAAALGITVEELLARVPDPAEQAHSVPIRFVK